MSPHPALPVLRQANVQSVAEALPRAGRGAGAIVGPRAEMQKGAVRAEFESIAPAREGKIVVRRSVDGEAFRVFLAGMAPRLEQAR